MDEFKEKAVSLGTYRNKAESYCETILSIFKVTGQLELANELIDFIKVEGIHDLEFLDQD